MVINVSSMQAETPIKITLLGNIISFLIALKSKENEPAPLNVLKK